MLCYKGAKLRNFLDMTKLARAKRLSLWLLLFFQFPKFTMNLGIVIANFTMNLGI